MSRRMETESNRRTGWDRIGYTWGHVRRFLRRDEPFQGSDSRSETLMPNVESWKKEEACHWLTTSGSPGHEGRPLLPHVAQLPDSRPHLHSLSACFCYHWSMRSVPWWRLGWEFPGMPARIHACQPALVWDKKGEAGHEPADCDKGSPFLLDRSEKACEDAHSEGTSWRLDGRRGMDMRKQEFSN